jgi:hypothetical protein
VHLGISHTNQEEEAAVCKRLRIHVNDFYQDGLVKRVAIYGKYITEIWDYADNSDI